MTGQVGLKTAASGLFGPPGDTSSAVVRVVKRTCPERHDDLHSPLRRRDAKARCSLPTSLDVAQRPQRPQLLGRQRHVIPRRELLGQRLVRLPLGLEERGVLLD